jgi:hypothetical protein
MKCDFLNTDIKQKKDKKMRKITEEIYFRIYKFCEKKLDFEGATQEEIIAQQVSQIIDEKLTQIEIEFGEKMIRVVEIMLETRNEIVTKANELIISNHEMVEKVETCK